MYGHHTNSRNEYQTSYKATFAVCRGSIRRLMRRCNLASLLDLVSRPNSLPWMLSLSVRPSMRPVIRRRSKSPTRSSCSSQLISCHCLWSTVYSFGPYCITWTRAMSRQAENSFRQGYSATPLQLRENESWPNWHRPRVCAWPSTCGQTGKCVGLSASRDTASSTGRWSL